MPPYKPGLEPSPLSIWMEQINPCSGELAWCHSTDAFALQKIIRRGELCATDPCGVFGEPLSYFFYGRPAYKKGDGASMRTTARAPVVIMMSPDIHESRKRVFPFDSGAFVQGRYSAWLHESMELQDFDITRLADSPRRYVPSFYASNRDYLRLRPRPPTVPYADYYQVEALVSMLNDTDTSRADDRRLAIELQIEKPIPFKWPQVQGLILPRDLESTSYVSSFLAGPGRGIDVRWFDVAPLKLATEYQLIGMSHDPSGPLDSRSSIVRATVNAALAAGGSRVCQGCYGPTRGLHTRRNDVGIVAARYGSLVRPLYSSTHS